MTNAKKSYKVTNNLDSFIHKEIGYRMTRNGIKVMKKDIINEIADLCEVSFENISRINRNVSQPSIAVALMISKYFKVNVNDIFKID